MELAVNDSNNQEDKKRDDSDRYNPIGSHSVSSVSGTTGQGWLGRGFCTCAPCPSTS